MQIDILLEHVGIVFCAKISGRRPDSGNRESSSSLTAQFTRAACSVNLAPYAQIFFSVAASHAGSGRTRLIVVEGSSRGEEDVRTRTIC